VLGLVCSVLSQEIGWEERLWNDLHCVEWDVKPWLSQSIATWQCRHSFVRLFGRLFGLIFLPWYLMNGLSNFDETYREYSLAPRYWLMSWVESERSRWQQAVKVVKASTSTLLFDGHCWNYSRRCLNDICIVFVGLSDVSEHEFCWNRGWILSKVTCRWSWNKTYHWVGLHYIMESMSPGNEGLPVTSSETRIDCRFLSSTVWTSVYFSFITEDGYCSLPYPFSRLS